MSGQSHFEVSCKTIRQEQKKVVSNENDLLTYFPHMKDKLKTLSRIEHTEVISQIESSNKGGVSITNNWRFEVWKTKDIDKYSGQVKEIGEDFNRNPPSSDSLELEQLVERSNLLQARVRFTLDTITFLGDKEKLTSQTYCIVSLEEQ